MQMLARTTPKALYTVAQGRRSSGAPWVCDYKTCGYSEGVKKNDARDRLYNAFGVNDWFMDPIPRVRRFAATLGYGV
jgi:hypothetical protein